MRRLLIYVLVGPLLAGMAAGREMRRPAGRLVLTLRATVAPGAVGTDHGRRATDLTERHRPCV